MAATNVAVKFTYDDYRLFPNDGRRHELVDGEHIMSPSPKSKHQIAAANLYSRLDSFIRSRKLGRLFFAPFDVIFSEYDVVEPDIFFIAAARVEKLVQDWVRGAPDLVIEIISASTGEIDRTLKFKQYEKFGVSEYWIVDPDAESVEVYVLRDQHFESLVKARGAESIESVVLSGLALEVYEIFEI